MREERERRDGGMDPDQHMEATMTHTSVFSRQNLLLYESEKAVLYKV